MRLPRALAVAALAAAATVTTGLAVPADAAPTRTAAAAPAYNDWPTYHAGTYRTGVNMTMPAVHGLIHVAFKTALDGAVYASPIVIGGVTVVATENNTVYAFRANNTLLWKRHIGTPSPASERPCGNIDPLGITGTPAYSAVTKQVIFAAELTTGSSTPPVHQLWALALSSGAVASHRTLDLPGVDQRVMQQRGAIAVTNTRVYVPFGGLSGDCGAYKGRVVSYPLSAAGAVSSYTVPTAREAGIWTPPGPTIDKEGNIFVAVGNGESGVGDPYDFSDSVLELTPSLTLKDSYSPSTWPSDNDADLDLGSQGPTLVGNYVFSAGKSGTAYVLAKTKLGGIGGEVSQAKICRSFGGTAVLGNVVYVPCTDGLRAVQVDATGHMKVLWHTAAALTGSPVIGAGRLWTLVPGVGALYALDLATGGTHQKVSVGVTSRFATPALYGRNVYVPTLSGLTVVATS